MSKKTKAKTNGKRFKHPAEDVHVAEIRALKRVTRLAREVGTLARRVKREQEHAHAEMRALGIYIGQHAAAFETTEQTDSER